MCFIVILRDVDMWGDNMDYPLKPRYLTSYRQLKLELKFIEHKPFQSICRFSIIEL